MAALPESVSAGGSFPVKGEFFLSTITLWMGDWIKEKFWCSLLVSLGRQLFLIGSV